MLEISVIIPVYNAERFLSRAVHSALQFLEVREVILVEDKSPDQSLELCYQLANENPRIKVFQHPDKGNHGAGASRNLGLEKATQNYIAFLDSDDYYLPNRFEAEKNIFKNSKIEGVFGALGIDFLTEKGEEEFKAKFKNTQITTVKYEAEGQAVFNGIMAPNNKFGTFFHLNTITIKRLALLREKLNFNKELRVHQDQDFITKLAYHLYLKTGNITEPIAMRGVHDDNRITKIIPYSEAYNQRQNLLWNSIWNWAKDKSMDSEIKNHIYLQSKAFNLSQSKGLKKWIQIFMEMLKNPSILKTRYRFTYFK